MAASERKPNRLITETSPYLLQHAHNPVEWYPWGAEALERARREERPIFLSIGYAACHWCHVMERESFENEEIARRLNENFVCIKVDREERPDLDEIYMAATVAMSGGGGWPMTVFLTPDQRPFFAGTYFPPQDKWGRPGFGTLLERIATLWREERDDLSAQADELVRHVVEQSKLAEARSIDLQALDAAVEQLDSAFDPRFGGFGAAPKFPPCSALDLLLRHLARTGDGSVREMIEKTLDGMKNGGIYDHLGGGFARYSTDERWLVPHFEKMLYDNAGLARVYLHAHQATGSAEYARVARETLDYVLREMQSPEGGYYSATDADSEGVEGKFFVWTREELDALLGADEAARFAAHYDVRPSGNWEGHSILNTPRPLESVAAELGLEASALGESLAKSRATLLAARAKRVPPLLDDKVLTAWNGLMISALAEGYRVLGDPRYLESAERAAGFLQDRLLRPDGGLYRTARGGKAHLDAYLEDYAYLGDALVDLYEASGDEAHLRAATGLAERMLADFGDERAGAFYFTAHGHEKLVARTREGHDGALPNANAVAARLLARLAVLLDRESFRERAVRALAAYGELMSRSPRSFATSLTVLDFLAEPPIELVLVGSAEERATQRAALARHYLPNRAIAHVDPDARGELDLPLAREKTKVAGRAALYVCRNFTCQAPITDLSALEKALDDDARARTGARRTRIGGRHLPGRATPEGTRAYAEKQGDSSAERGFAELGRAELAVSRVGFGGYRIDRSSRDHREALAHALSNGVNLIDTSTNYGDGESEELVGEVLAELSAGGALWRDQIVVVTKVGYVQGRNLALAEARENRGHAFPEMVKVGRGIWHCLHPEWIEDQIGRSLERLGLETLDVCLLHNPEYCFTDAIRRGEGPLDALRAEFQRRIEAAFVALEAERKRGRIATYGVSSNTVAKPADDRDKTSLAGFLAAARSAGGDGHGFAVLELPLNLFESEAALADEGQTTLAEAARAGLAVLCNRPLNVLAGDGLLRLADVPNLAGALPVDAALADLEAIEREFKQSFASKIRTGEGSPPAESLLDWATQLGRLPAQAQTYADFSQIEREVVRPRTHHVLSALDRAFSGDSRAVWQEFSERYTRTLDGLLASLRQRAVERSRGIAHRIHSAIDPHLPAERRASSLSQKAIWTLASTPGVTSVLVGMRRPSYVGDVMPTLSWQPHERPLEVLKAVREIAGLVAR
ncbi:MAG: aldo/keto reductase [Polyangiaceae bacterium]